ncbi:MAG: HigA family addiction module antidote protein [Dehalococcoidia bacterium]|nr:HigA family addiction module antidote protein [Dehalococcoidia bacterium]
MTSTMTALHSDLAIPPGELLAEELEVRGLTQSELAEQMGRPRQVISAIIHGKKAITAETALQLEGALGIPAHLWIGLEGRYQLALARRAAAKGA